MDGKTDECFMEELSWNQARQDISKVKPELAAIIDEISPDKSYALYKVRYPYGSTILKQGMLHLPDHTGKLLPIIEQTTKIQSRLGYNLNSNPVCMALNNTIELFLTLNDRTIPFYGLVPAGKIFGTWRMLIPPVSHHPIFLWDMTAGARSIFMLPKIQKQVLHDKMRKKLHLSAETPKTLLEHWEVFKQIAVCPLAKKSWYTDMIFFSKKWFENLEDKAWESFNYYLLKQAWLRSDFWRSEFIWDLIFSLIQFKKNIKPSAHIANTVKYLLAIAANAVPAFAPAIDNTAAPIDLIQEAYIDYYKLQDYAPIIMQPVMFDMYKNSRPVYYSLRFPSAVEFAKKSSEQSTVITDLYNVKSLMNKYLHEIKHSKFNIETTPLFDLIQHADFNYFHTGTEEYMDLRESSNIPREDNTFMPAKFKDRQFPAASTFVRGCVRISAKNKK